MADFCKQCSIELFGKDFGDLANLSDEELPENHGWATICEGCGYVLVDNNGKCLGGCMKPEHNKKEHQNG